MSFEIYSQVLDAFSSNWYYLCYLQGGGGLFTKRTRTIARSRDHEMGYYYSRGAWKLDMYFSRVAATLLPSFQSDPINANPISRVIVRNHVVKHPSVQ